MMTPHYYSPKLSNMVQCAWQRANSWRYPTKKNITRYFPTIWNRRRPVTNVNQEVTKARHVDWTVRKHVTVWKSFLKDNNKDRIARVYASPLSTSFIAISISFHTQEITYHALALCNLALRRWNTVLLSQPGAMNLVSLVRSWSHGPMGQRWPIGRHPSPLSLSPVAKV